MVACFGIHDGYQLARFPAERLIERNPRIDVWMLLQCGGLLPGTTTELQWTTGGCRCLAGTGNVEIDGTRVPVI